MKDLFSVYFITHNPTINPWTEKECFYPLCRPAVFYFDDDQKGPYELAANCINKKTHFALDILYHSDENFSNWSIPAYIKNGLLWLKED